jgi:hypothetical protein
LKNTTMERLAFKKQQKIRELALKLSYPIKAVL